MGFSVPFQVNAGTDIVGASLPAGEIRAIRIENPTGAWVYLPSLREYIRPYTLGWARVLDNGVSSIDLDFAATGPDGTASVNLGDPLRLTLYDWDSVREGAVSTSSGSLFVPIAHKRVVTTAAFANLGVTAFTGADAGRLVAGVQIDNPSGAWLSLVVGGATFSVPPYTLRWVKRIDPPVANVTSLSFAAAGPAGQISTRQGDQVTLTILDMPPDAPDTAFVEGFTPVLTVSDTQVAIVSGAGTFPLIAAIANQRVRIHSIVAELAVAETPGASFNQSPVSVWIFDTTTNDYYFRCQLSPQHPTVDAIYPEGLDFVTGRAVGWVGTPAFANVTVTVTVTYSMI